jgi:hypothetical protein
MKAPFMKNEAIEASVAAVASKSTYAGAGSAALGWFLSNEFAVVFGIVVAAVGLLVNWYYKRKADRRAEHLHAVRLRRLNAGLSDLHEGEYSDE